MVATVVGNQDCILDVRGLVTSFQTEQERVRAVDDVSFSLRRGATLGVVGESGCGKSVTALSILRLLPKPTGMVEGGEILFHGQDLLKLPIADMHTIRGRKIAMIFQEPMTALNPVHSVGRQLGEVFQLHFPQLSSAEIIRRSITMLERVGIAAPETRLKEYPHQLSGGMRQRVMIAIALACEPDILIADEPTTALDVTIQAQIINLIRDLQQKNGMSVIFITHDLGVIAEISTDVLVMYGGKVVETSPVAPLFAKPTHPYTQGLLKSIPRLDGVRKSRLEIIEGMVPALHEMPQGCRFQNRCPVAQPLCSTVPPLVAVGPDHATLCHNVRPS